VPANQQTTAGVLRRRPIAGQSPCRRCLGSECLRVPRAFGPVLPHPFSGDFEVLLFAGAGRQDQGWSATGPADTA